MPFELIVQSAFTERLDGGGMRIRRAGEHITDPEHVEALRGQPHVVQVWVDEPPKAKSPPTKPVVTDPASAPLKP